LLQKLTILCTILILIVAIIPPTHSTAYQCQSDDEYCDDPECEDPEIVCYYDEEEEVDDSSDSEGEGCLDEDENGVCDTDECYDVDNDGYCDDDPSICIDDDGNDVCDVDEGPSTPDTSSTNDWMNACSTVQEFLYQSCDSYVNSDGTLTSEGEKAVICIRNGAVLAVGGTVGGVPPSIAADILGGLAEITGCGGIVDMDEVKRMVSFGGLTDLGGLTRFLP
jgi:hypothetical protein